MEMSGEKSNGKNNALNKKVIIPERVINQAIGDLEAMEGVALQNGEKSRIIRSFNSGDTRMSGLFDKYPGLRSTHYLGTIYPNDITFGRKYDNIQKLIGIDGDDSNIEWEYRKNHVLDIDPAIKKKLREAKLGPEFNPNDSDDYYGPPGSGRIEDPLPTRGYNLDGDGRYD